MIFIGIFGIKEVQKSIGPHNNVICPACHALTRLEVFKTYACFHVFFIPIFKWNTKYSVKSACCGSIYEFDPIYARQYEKGQITEIRDEYLRSVNHFLSSSSCANCGANVEPGFSFCPYCGRRL
ncbi:MAG: zinc ribbon domain-containing protein [Desulfitobacteriaceae bacterium]|nr:zinc ribbon domain-containing protein [Desulfitobacteriaceae bacterium]MDD4345802.1 zinc ribbon domain-containing protein [Desulfitobacteriaceae bacterium]MDD4402264.1 zinc ribbon domain-containing protein [Desulfitobacteriaceae bacterium]